MKDKNFIRKIKSYLFGSNATSIDIKLTGSALFCIERAHEIFPAHKC